MVAGAADVKCPVEITRCSPEAARSGSRKILIDVRVRTRVEFSHVVPVYDIEVAIFPAADRQMSGNADAVDHIRKNHDAP